MTTLFDSFLSPSLRMCLIVSQAFIKILLFLFIIIYNLLET